jgi:alkylated DNA repair protein alkB family protein 6
VLQGVVNSGVWADTAACFAPNHVLINDYLPGQGIMHHTDGPLYLGYVVILSLCSGALLSFRPKLDAENIGVKAANDVASVYLQPRSALIFSNEAYGSHMHGIENVADDCIHEGMALLNRQSAGIEDGIFTRRRRISLTIRRKLE